MGTWRSTATNGVALPPNEQHGWFRCDWKNSDLNDDFYRYEEVVGIFPELPTTPLVYAHHVDHAPESLHPLLAIDLALREFDNKPLVKGLLDSRRERK